LTKFLNKIKKLLDKFNFNDYHHNMNNQTITENIVKMMDRGLIVIPQEIRKKGGLSKGSYLRVILRTDEIVLKPLNNENQQEKDVYYFQGIPIKKSPYTKEQKIKILSQIGKISWTKNDDLFLKKGRKKIEKRLKKYNQL
jgi:AbrB family looped-hinge helix DNA binding protein